MIEYLFNAIRATAGEDITVVAQVTEDYEPVTSGCGFMIHIDDETAVMVDGVYEDGVWSFHIPADATKGLKGRYWYCLYKDGSTLCFKEPIYFM